MEELEQMQTNADEWQVTGFLPPEEHYSDVSSFQETDDSSKPDYNDPTTVPPK